MAPIPRYLTALALDVQHSDDVVHRYEDSELGEDEGDEDDEDDDEVEAEEEEEEEEGKFVAPTSRNI